MDVLFIPSLTQSLEAYLIDDDANVNFKIVKNKSMLPIEHNSNIYWPMSGVFFRVRWIWEISPVFVPWGSSFFKKK